MPRQLRPLVEGLAREGGREEAARQLAEAVGARHLLIYVLDAELGVMLPAPGMPKTITAGRSWRELMARCAAAADGEQAPSVVEVFNCQWHARCIVVRACAFVLLGEEQCTFPSELVDQLPVLGELLHAQAALRIGMAEVAAARDAATRAHQLAAALDATRAAAAELNVQLRLEHQRKDEFLAMLAHELRNPLAPVMTSIEVLRRLKPDNQSARDRHLSIMARQMQQLAHLVDDLLDVSRVSRGLIELRRAAVRLPDVVNDAVEATAPLLASRGHTLTCTVPAQGFYVDGDRVRLVQVFSNLLNNAAKYTEPGGRVEVQLHEAGDRAQVAIRDNGVGIPPEMLTSIFDLFTQVPGSIDRAPGGLGIGLTLARTLVELHGGSIEARSGGVGKGSEFIVTLPLVAEPVVVAPERGTHLTSELPEHVLVVDDNVDAAETLAEVFRMGGARVTVAHDGGQALQIAASGDLPQLVLLDIGLPGMDGFEVAREWRRRFGLSSRIVALTGYGGPEDRHRTSRGGFDAHLVKPVTMESIEATLRSIATKALAAGK